MAMRSTIDVSIAGAIATITLNDPAKRNALSLAMFDALDAAIADLAQGDAVHVVLLTGAGNVFCAGFDLAAANEDAEMMAKFIHRLSAVNRSLRRLQQVVVAAVQGAAIAGGCAMLSACDFVFVAPDALLGYPVHRIGVSPAVTIPTLQQAIGAGAARAMLMGGELISGATAHRLGLASHLASSATATLDEARAHCEQLARKGVHALRVTKAWLNELDGSLDDAAFDQSAQASAEIAATDEARTLLANWQLGRNTQRTR